MSGHSFNTAAKKIRRKRVQVLDDVLSYAAWERVFTSRKKTLMQKAYELEIATGVEISVTIHTRHGDAWCYASSNQLYAKLVESRIILDDCIRVENQTLRKNLSRQTGWTAATLKDNSVAMLSNNGPPTETSDGIGFSRRGQEKNAFKSGSVSGKSTNIVKGGVSKSMTNKRSSNVACPQLNKKLILSSNTCRNSPQTLPRKLPKTKQWPKQNNIKDSHVSRKVGMAEDSDTSTSTQGTQSRSIPTRMRGSQFSQVGNSRFMTGTQQTWNGKRKKYIRKRVEETENLIIIDSDEEPGGINDYTTDASLQIPLKNSPVEVSSSDSDSSSSSDSDSEDSESDESPNVSEPINEDKLTVETPNKDPDLSSKTSVEPSNKSPNSSFITTYKPSIKNSGFTTKIAAQPCKKHSHTSPKTATDPPNGNSNLSPITTAGPLNKKSDFSHEIIAGSTNKNSHASPELAAAPSNKDSDLAPKSAAESSNKHSELAPKSMSVTSASNLKSSDKIHANTQPSQGRIVPKVEPNPYEFHFALLNPSVTDCSSIESKLTECGARTQQKDESIQSHQCLSANQSGDGKNQIISTLPDTVQSFADHQSEKPNATDTKQPQPSRTKSPEIINDQLQNMNVSASKELEALKKNDIEESRPLTDNPGMKQTGSNQTFKPQRLSEHAGIGEMKDRNRSMFKTEYEGGRKWNSDYYCPPGKIPEYDRHHGNVSMDRWDHQEDLGKIIPRPSYSRSVHPGRVRARFPNPHHIRSGRYDEGPHHRDRRGGHHPPYHHNHSNWNRFRPRLREDEVRLRRVHRYYDRDIFGD